jgi:hypothetical protein
MFAGVLSGRTAYVHAPTEYVATSVETMVGDAAEQSPVMTVIS